LDTKAFNPSTLLAPKIVTQVAKTSTNSNVTFGVLDFTWNCWPLLICHSGDRWSRRCSIGIGR